MLAGMPKGPTYYSPDRHPDRAQERLAYVLDRMKEDGDAGVSGIDPTKVSLPRMVAYEHARYYGAELDDRSRPPGDHPRVGPTHFGDWLRHAAS